MAKQVEAQIRLTAKDESGGVLAAFSKRLENIHKLGAKLVERSGLPAISEALHGVHESAGRLHESIGGVIEGLTALAGISLGAGVAGIAESIKSSAENMDRLGQSSKQIGVGVNALRGIDAAAERAGVSAGTMNGALLEASKLYAALHNHVKSRSADMLKSLSPDLAGAIAQAKSAGRAYDIMFSALEGRSPEVRALLETRMFGTTDIDNIAQLGHEKWMQSVGRSMEGLGQLPPDAVERAGEFLQQTRDLRDAMQGIGDRIAYAVEKPLGDMLESISKFLDKHRDEISTVIAKGIKDVGEWLQNVDWQGYATRIGHFADSVNQVAQAFGGWEKIGLAYLALRLLSFGAGVLTVLNSVRQLGMAMVLASPTFIIFGFAALEIYKHWDELAKFFSQFAGKDFPESIKLLEDGIKAAIPVITKDMDDLYAAMLPDWFKNSVTAFGNTGGWLGAKLGTNKFGPWVKDILGFDRGGGTANQSGKGDIGRPNISAPAIEHPYRGAGTGGDRFSVLGRINDWFGPPQAQPPVGNQQPPRPETRFHEQVRKTWDWLTAPGAPMVIPSPPTGRIYARATGGPVPAGGLSVVGEHGPELVSFGSFGNVLSNANSGTLMRFAQWAAAALPAVLMDLVQVLSDLRDAIMGRTPGGGYSYGAGLPSGAGLPTFPARSAGDQHAAAAAGAYAANLAALPNAGKLANAAGFYSMLRGNGVPREVAIGALASVMGESGPGLRSTAYRANDNGGPSGGMMQWHDDGHGVKRFTGLLDFAKRMSKTWIDPALQISYGDYELHTRFAKVLEHLKHAHTWQEGVSIWTSENENPQDDKQGFGRYRNIPYAIRAANIADQQASAPEKHELTVTLKNESDAHISHVKTKMGRSMQGRVAIDNTGKRWHRGYD